MCKNNGLRIPLPLAFMDICYASGLQQNILEDKHLSSKKEFDKINDQAHKKTTQTYLYANTF